MKRIIGILVRPTAEWAAIAGEPMSPGVIFVRYIAPLALIPSLSTVIGITFFGIDWNTLHGYSVSKDQAFVTGAKDFMFIVATIPALALILHALARVGRKSAAKYVDALKVATFGAVPILLAGVFLVLPVMVMLSIVAGMHSLYLINSGLKAVMRVSASEAPMLVGVAIVMLTLVGMVFGAIFAALVAA